MNTHPVSLRAKLIQIAHTALRNLGDNIPDEPLSVFRGEGTESEGMTVAFSQNNIDIIQKDSNIETIAECLRAIEKIDEETYGFCDECDEEILPGRLKLMPYVIHCTKCKSDIEKTNKQLFTSSSNNGPRSYVIVKILRRQLACIAHA